MVTGEWTVVSPSLRFLCHRQQGGTARSCSPSGLSLEPMAWPPQPMGTRGVPPVCPLPTLIPVPWDLSLPDFSATLTVLSGSLLPFLKGPDPFPLPRPRPRSYFWSSVVDLGPIFSPEISQLPSNSGGTRGGDGTLEAWAMEPPAMTHSRVLCELGPASRAPGHQPARLQAGGRVQGAGQGRCQGNEKPQPVLGSTPSLPPSTEDGFLSTGQGPGGPPGCPWPTKTHGRGGRRELARLRAWKPLPRKPSVPGLVSVLLNSGQGRGPSAERPRENSFAVQKTGFRGETACPAQARPAGGRPDSGPAGRPRLGGLEAPAPPPPPCSAPAPGAPGVPGAHQAPRKRRGLAWGPHGSPLERLP